MNENSRFYSTETPLLNQRASQTVTYTSDEKRRMGAFLLQFACLATSMFFASLVAEAARVMEGHRLH